METPRILTWLQSLSDSTRYAYEKTLNDFIRFGAQNPELSINDQISTYLEALHDCGVKTSTLWTILSPIKTFTIFNSGYNFYDSNPHFIKVMKQWAKKESTKQSKVSRIKFEK